MLSIGVDKVRYLIRSINYTVGLVNFKTKVTGIISSLNGSELMIRVLATFIKDG